MPKVTPLPPRGHYLAHEVGRFAGVSGQTIGHWARYGHVDSSQSVGPPRVYSGDDIPRGLEFLLSRNRLNVAISRACCLAYLVCSPRLLEVNAHTIPQMRLANALCRFVEFAEDE